MDLMQLATISSGLAILAMLSCRLAMKKEPKKGISYGTSYGLAMNKTDKKGISYGLSCGLAMNKTDKKAITYGLAMD